MIPIDIISPSTHQARKVFDEDSLLGLAESLRQEGLIQAVTVRPLPPSTGDGPLGSYELISGERRWRAAQLLGWQSIEAKVIEVTSEGEAAAKSLLENLQREDLNPIEEAEGFFQLHELDPAYWTQERIGTVAGKSRSYVTQSLALVRLPEPVQDDVRRRTYSRGHAIELCRLADPSLQVELSKQIPGGLTREKIRLLVDRALDHQRRSDLKGKPKAGAAPPEGLGSLPDPLGDLWPAFVKNPWISALGHLAIRYLGDMRWAFEVRVPLLASTTRRQAERRAALREELGELLIRMGRSLRFDTHLPDSGGADSLIPPFPL